MTHILCPAGDQLASAPVKVNASGVRFQSFWVLVGFTFWFGFYLGALIMHSVTK